MALDRKTDWHPLLARQLKRCDGLRYDTDDALSSFIHSVNEAYVQSDDDRAMLERSLELSSDELLNANADLQIRRDNAEAMFRDLFANLQEGVVILDARTGRVQQLNGAACELFGVSEGDLPTIELETVIKDYRFDSEYSNYETIVRTVSGSKVVLLSQARIDHESSDPTTIMIVTDITKRKQEELELSEAKKEAENYSRLKSDFLSTMSHELRTPLTAILGFASVLSKEIYGELNDKQRLYLNHISESGRHLEELINNILDLAKIEARKMQLRADNVDIASLVRQCVTIVGERIREKKLHVTESISDPIPNVVADATKLKQIMFNLLSNAIKFTPEDGRISVMLDNDPERELVCLTVSDNGIGIASKDRELVFNEFEQVASSHSRKYTGTGLGLPLTKRLVELHGGKIWFDSPGENLGTTFFVELPHRAVLSDGELSDDT